jgi:hypothetical protein
MMLVIHQSLDNRWLDVPEKTPRLARPRPYGKLGVRRTAAAVNTHPTERSGRVVNTPVLHSGGPGFKSRPGHRLSQIKFFVVFLSPSWHMPGKWPPLLRAFNSLIIISFNSFGLLSELQTTSLKNKNKSNTL